MHDAEFLMQSDATKPHNPHALTLSLKGAPIKHEWSPYEDNGGTVAGVAGKGYVIVAGDTRLNGDFCINTRFDDSKVKMLTPKTLLASSGMQADRLYLQQMIDFRLQWYSFNNGGTIPPTSAIAQLLSSVLYQRRFFPLYAISMVAGLDAEGNGVCYSYDVIGNTEPLKYGSTGSSESFITPLFDALIARRNMAGQAPAELSCEDALTLMKGAFTSAGERDIFTGDSVVFHILTPEGLRKEIMPLRKD